MSPPAALEAGWWRCPVCGRLHRPDPSAERPHCLGCGERLHPRRKHALSRTLAFTVTALLLLPVSYALPVLRFTYRGEAEDSTILSSVHGLWQEGFFGIALLVFTASFCVPLFKVASLLYLTASLRFRLPGSPRMRTRLYHFLAFIGRWSMLDVFVVGLLAAIVRFGTLAEMTPGPGAAYFCGVVVATLLATLHFDPRLIWDRERQRVPKEPHA